MTGDGATPPAPLSVAERALAGRQVRDRVPRASFNTWTPPADRDPIALLLSDEADRLPELLPLRHERMAASSFAFYRGSAIIFAADAAGQQDTGLRTQLCGDAHLANFGGHATPERELVFDLNDFDETCPGPFEWDLKRLAASFEIAGRANGFDETARSAAVRESVRAYSSRMGELAGMGNLEIINARLKIDDLIGTWRRILPDVAIRRFERNVRKARAKDRLRALAKLTEEVGGELRFVNDPPVLERLEDLAGPELIGAVMEHLETAIAGYRDSLAPDRRQLFDRYHLVDVARKVVGVGSVGTRCWVALLIGRDAGDPLFLQVKEAGPSVIEPYAGKSPYQHHGRRVVEGQRLQQSATDIFLGWTQATGRDGRVHDYYLRQLWDQKGSALLDQLEPEAMFMYARMCGYAMARSHARAGDPIAMSAYLGAGKSLARALVEFSSAYADQNELDHAQFVVHLKTTAAAEAAVDRDVVSV